MLGIASTLARRSLKRTRPLSWSRCLSVGHYKKDSDDSDQKKDSIHKAPPLHNYSSSPKESNTPPTELTRWEKTKAMPFKRWEKIKHLFQEYKYPFVAYYAVAYITPIIPIYLGLEFYGVDGVEVLQWVSQAVQQTFNCDTAYIDGIIVRCNPDYVNLFISGEINELLEVIRFPLVLTTTPKVADWFRGLKSDGYGGL